MERPAAGKAVGEGRASLMNAVVKGFRGFAGYLRAVMGADAYQKYVEHFEAVGHSGPLMSEREFWRDRMDRQDTNPQGRCC